MRKSHCISKIQNIIFPPIFFFVCYFTSMCIIQRNCKKKIYQSSTTHIPFHYYVKFKKCRIYYNVCLLLNSNLKYGWVGDSCLNVKQAVTMARTCYMIKWDDDDIFVLDQHAELGFYSASSLKQQFVGRLSLYS